MNMYLYISEPGLNLQISHPPKIAQNWFCIQNLLCLMLFYVRIVGRLSDPLVGVHGQQMDGSDRVVPGGAGLS